MDTIYYHLNAIKVKVSGGADLLTFVPAAAPAPAEAKGEVLDFARCRQKLETKAAWRDLSFAAAEAAAPEELEDPEPVLPHARRERAANWLELCASVAVIAVSLAAVAAFLRLV